MLLRRISFVSILLLSLGGIVAFANPKPLTLPFARNCAGHQRQSWDGQRLTQELKLNPEQNQKLQSIHLQYKDQISQRQKALHQATQELRQLMAGTANPDQIRAKHEQVEQMRQQLEELRFESMLAMREVLTLDQRSRFAQLMQQRREKHHARQDNTIGTQN